MLQYFNSLPLKINTFMWSFNNENDQCIAAHLFCFYIKTNAPVFRLFTPQNDRLVMSFNRKDDPRVAAQPAVRRREEGHGKNL